MSASFSASQSEIKSRGRTSEMTPLKLCVKYAPPSLALYYTLASTPGKKYLHVIKVEGSITEEITAEDIYKNLLTVEPAYLNPKIISKRQIIKLVSQLLSKIRLESKRTAEDTKHVAKKEEDDVITENASRKSVEQDEATVSKVSSNKDDHSSYSKQLSMESAVYSNAVPVIDVDVVDNVNADSVVLSNPKVEFNPTGEQHVKSPREDPAPFKLETNTKQMEIETEPVVKSKEKEEKNENEKNVEELHEDKKEPTANVDSYLNEEFEPEIKNGDSEPRTTNQKAEYIDKEEQNDIEPITIKKKERNVAIPATDSAENGESGEDGEGMEEMEGMEGLEGLSEEEIAQLMSQRQGMQQAYEEMLMSNSAIRYNLG